MGGRDDSDGGREGERGGALAPLALYVVTPALIAGLMMYYLLTCWRAVGELGFPLDDSWIHVRFAQNLAAGHGFSFNPGQPASSTTGPLWTVLLAGGYRITGEYLFTSAVLNWLLCVLTALTAGALAEALVPRRQFGAAVALVVAATVPLPWLALSGMEPPLYAWLTLLGILLHVRLRKDGGPKSLLPSAVFALAVYARPECLLLFPLAMLDRVLGARSAEGGKGAGWRLLRQLAVHTVVFLVIVGPLFAYNYSVTKRPLPSSYYIKAMNYGVTWAIAMGDDELLQQCLLVAPAKEMGALLLLWATNNVALIVPFLFGFVLLARGAREASPVGQRSYLIPLVLIVQPVAWAISTNCHRTPDFQGQRYVANLGPLYVVVGMAGVWWLGQRLGAGPRRIAMPIAIALVLIASLARQPAYARIYTHNVKNITEMHVAMARWIQKHLPQESYLCLNDVGAIAVITGCRVLDTQGLVSPETLACLTLDRARDGTWRDCLRDVIERERPDYRVIVTRPDLPPPDGSGPQFFRHLHEIEIEDNVTAGGPIIAAYQTAWCRYPPRLPVEEGAGP